MRATVPSVASFPVSLTETLGTTVLLIGWGFCSQITSPLYRTLSTPPSTPAPLGSLTCSLASSMLAFSTEPYPFGSVLKILFSCLCWLEGLFDSEVLRHGPVTMDECVTWMWLWWLMLLCLCHWLLIRPEIIDNVNLCLSFSCRKTVCTPHC